ncbi:MAG: SMC-Scp complex subunit ScpB [Candidatus Freyarchaeota archaeon]|nr:SMC-Scp complex subunit ScpB [Candidatus Jordarchaeia archaeon]MBS7268726.1 SMC-Scp complex subunit ScpB [Candidatus Jordarchaeia archaeon]MBS7279395.1 SMC-Scp complex subunit ScpB [Candidatus Jordarchaeia archaeon]
MAKDAKMIIEAALYAAGRPLSIEQIAEIAKIDNLEYVDELVRQLIREYEERNSALEIVALPGSKYVLQLKPSYSNKISNVASRGLLSLGELKTLAYIALKQPIEQSKVAKARGSHSYKHIKKLEELGFLKFERAGRTKIFQTTEMFADYFGFDHEPRKLKQQLRWRIRKEGIQTRLDAQPEATQEPEESES